MANLEIILKKKNYSRKEVMQLLYDIKSSLGDYGFKRCRIFNSPTGGYIQFKNKVKR